MNDDDRVLREKLSLDRRIRDSFEEHLAIPDWGSIDLSMALFAEMTERMSRVEIAATEINDRYIEKQLAFAVFRTQFLHPDQLTEGDKTLVEAIAAALTDPNASIQLRLKRSARGKPKSYLDFERQMEKERQVVERLASEIEQGTKLESAVASLSATLGLSRSTIFAMWRQRQMHTDWHKRAHEISPQLAPGPSLLVARPMLQAVKDVLKNWLRKAMSK